ncbi:MAG TPA: DUF6429 family protein, partial [Burkholderiales bacterium]|nr:DUF6429 family protein [Burkholderiales bacterium]
AASEERIEETVLALLYVCSVCEDGARRSWKTYDWGVTEHLFEKGLIDNPRSNRKSVLLTPEGEALGKVLAEKLFGGSVR